MSKQVLMKGNEAIGEAAVLAGCRHYFGYPITPQTEIPEYLSRRMPQVEGVFLQAESEVAAINMVYGAAAAGARVMTSSSGPGLSLKQEGLSSLAGAELPCVVVNMSRGGPGIGTIQGAQGDYFQSTKGGGHGDYRLLVLAPASVQELVDLTVLAFEKADAYRNPVLILGDGVLGQMMEPVDLPEPLTRLPEKPWSATGMRGRDHNNIITTLYLATAACEAHNVHLQEKYAAMAETETRWEEYETQDADWIITAFGISARIAVSAMQEARGRGLKVGVFRPISLWPFPAAALKAAAAKARGILVVEQNAGQMIEDVRLAVECALPVHFYGRMGGSLPDPAEILSKLEALDKDKGDR